ncbi:hypothetical protein AJ80_01532 [Polytolypa hystricis UAMH7299]|uniref:Uncharacterized protein n=1 Tax=Polytolypa hystricis (strain UAMH7299) TaxID=1447883 RepID=A0A2B7Z0W3_POLH7|nr:hypothetical protein AJ80_01532 [Polytolypa hystricis UAMH7299]
MMGQIGLRRHYIYRCGEPTKATEETINKIRSLGVTHIFDLRSIPEIKQFQVSGSAGSVPNWPGVERVYCLVFLEDSYDPVSLARRHADYKGENPQDILNAYSAILK